MSGEEKKDERLPAHLATMALTANGTALSIAVVGYLRIIDTHLALPKWPMYLYFIFLVIALSAILIRLLDREILRLDADAKSIVVHLKKQAIEMRTILDKNQHVCRSSLDKLGANIDLLERFWETKSDNEFYIFNRNKSQIEAGCSVIASCGFIITTLFVIIYI